MKKQADVLKNLDGSRIRAVLVPISRLADIKNEIIKFREREKLNEYQKNITFDSYVLDLPELEFEPKSILIAVTKYNLIKIKFIWQGKIVTDIGKLTEDEAEIPNIIKSCGVSFEDIFWLPQKRLAVQSGLAEYGRNNVTFVPDWGSFFGIDTYITDVPCRVNHIWRSAVCMAICDSCGLCIRDCPTGSIRNNRFLINNENCLSHILANMLGGGEPLPDWLPPGAVNSLSGCLRCQLKCPPNREMLKNITDEIIFGEYETDLMLNGVARDHLPPETQEKLNAVNLRDWRYDGIPRNLKNMFDNVIKGE